MCAMDLDALDEQYRRQSAWFAGVRTALLRRVRIREKRRVLDLGCGTGAVTPELARRCEGEVVSLDLDPAALAHRPEQFRGARRLVASAEALPFPDRSFDLIFTQMLFLWVPDALKVAAECFRVLRPGCELLLAAKPDLAGIIEQPETGRIGPRLIEGLRALGADPSVARKLPEALAAAGFHVTQGVHPSLFQPDEMEQAWAQERRFVAALGHPLPDPAPAPAFLFVPYFWFLARRTP